MTKQKRVVRPAWPIEVIAWIDHGEPMDKRVWDVPSHPGSMLPIVVFTCGFVISENEQILEVARDTSEFGHASAPLHILKKCILSRKRVAAPKISRALTTRL